jgi:hypothetical protein
MDYPTLLWLSPIAVLAGIGVYGRWIRRRDRERSTHLMLAAVWCVAMYVAVILVPICEVEGFEGPWTTIDGKLPVECRA